MTAEKRYTLILKDTLLERNPDNGREQSTISWECDFELPWQTVPGDAKDRSIFIPWSSLNPTYRGKLKKDAEPIDLMKIKRFSIMMRRWAMAIESKICFRHWLTMMFSFFGTQEGDFSLTIRSIKALSHAPSPSVAQTVDSDLSKLEMGLSDNDNNQTGATPHPNVVSTTVVGRSHEDRFTDSRISQAPRALSWLKSMPLILVMTFLGLAVIHMMHHCSSE